MSLNIIYGKCKSGKTHKMFELMQQCEQNNMEPVILVPSYAKMKEENEYINSVNCKGIFNVKITSIEEYIASKLDVITLTKNKAYITDEAYTLVVANILKDNQDMLKMFSKVKNKPGYIDTFINLMKRFESENVEEKEIEKHFEEQKSVLDIKFMEFLNLYKIVKKELDSNFVSKFDLYDLYIKKIIDKEIVPPHTIFFDGYNNFSEKEFMVINAYIQAGCEVYVTIAIDSIPSEVDIFMVSNDTIKRFKKITSDISYIHCVEDKNKVTNDVKTLQNNLYIVRKLDSTVETTNVSSYICTNASEEITYIANDILKKVRDGARYNDFVIATNDINTYGLYIKQVFLKYKIPVYVDEGMHLMSSNIATYIFTVLKLASIGFNINNSDLIIESLKTGLWDVTYDETCLLYNYMKEFNIKGYEFVSIFKKNNKIENKTIYDLEKINSIREKVYLTINDLASKLSTCDNATNYTRCIYDFLHQNMVIERYANLLATIEQIDTTQYMLKTQTLKKIYDIMDNICIAFDNITLNRYIYLLELGCKNSDINIITPMLDQVHLEDINKSNGSSMKHLYIVGVYDGGLPKVQSEDFVFSDLELKKLEEYGILLKQNTITRMSMEKYNIYYCINRATDTITFLMPQMSMTGSTYTKSQLIFDIKKLIHLELKSAPSVVDFGINHLLQKLTSAELDEKTSSQMYNEYILVKKQYEDIFNYVQREDNLNEDTIEKVYVDKKLNASVSNLEQFKLCPFNYCMKYLMHISPLNEYNITNIDIGNIMHAVMEKFSQKLIEKNMKYKEVVLDENENKVITWIGEIVDDIMSQYETKYINVSRFVYLKRKLKQSMSRVIFGIAQSFAQSQFNELGSEIVFGKNGIYSPIEINLSKGKKMLLKGKIDRVDTSIINEKQYMRIIDYKTYAKNISLKDVQEGVSLQLMTYMMAMLENYQKQNLTINPASIGYITLNEQTLSFLDSDNIDEKVKKKIIECLKIKGIYVSNIEVLKALDNEYENSKLSYLNVSPKTKEESKKKISEEDFSKECLKIKETLKNIGEEILSGKTKIEGYRKKDGPCKYCSYRSICKKAKE